MASTPDWQYILCKTPDPRDPAGELEEIGELESARSRNVEILRNRGGSAGCSISVYDDFAGEILDRVVLGDIRGTIRKSIIIRRNKIDMWGGPLMSIQGSLSEGASAINLGFVGWLEFLYYRHLYAEKHYTTLRQDEIAYDLLRLANTQHPAHPVQIFPGTSIGDMPYRSPTFAKGDTFGASIQKLSDVESGFDFEVHPRTRKLNLFAWDSYTVKSNVKLGYRWGPENIQKLDWNENGSATRNHLIVSGSNNVPYSIHDGPSQDDYGLFEEDINLPVETGAIIPAYANAELSLRAYPQISFTVTPKPVSEDDDSPRLFNDFQIGDQIAFTAKEGYFKLLNQGIRVFGANVSISDDNVETIDTLQTSPAT